jgi:ATP-dependent Zn protease
MASLPQEPQRGMPRTPRALWGWWLVLLALLVWNAVTFLPAPRPEVNIPYTTLLVQVRAGNVAKVRIVGDAIRGSFVKPVPWPQPTPATMPSPASGPPEQKPSGQPAAAPPATYTAFTTTFPQAIGDPTLLPLLEAQRVLVDVAPPPTHWLAYILTEGLPFLFLLGFFVLMGRKAAQGQRRLFAFGRSTARRYTSDYSEVTFVDVAGADEAKAALPEEVDFLRHAEKYHDVGARIPRGVLLVGPPGTGKTLLVRAVAGEAAQDHVVLGGARPPLQDPQERRVAADHEAGHTVVAWLTPTADAVHKVTVMAHGRALGVTQQLPGEDRSNYRRSELLVRLAVMLAGRTAEEIVFGDVTTGAVSDLTEATRLARHMVTRWGMGDLGLVAFQADAEHPFLGDELAQGHDYSEATAARIDEDSQRLLAERHAYTRRLLTDARAARPAGAGLVARGNP